jgi:hypothetical protein
MLERESENDQASTRAFAGMAVAAKACAGSINGLGADRRLDDKGARQRERVECGDEEEQRQETGDRRARERESKGSQSVGRR